MNALVANNADRTTFDSRARAPGAPVCVEVGAFVGGALAAFGASSLWLPPQP